MVHKWQGGNLGNLSNHYPPEAGHRQSHSPGPGVVYQTFSSTFPYLLTAIAAAVWICASVNDLWTLHYIMKTQGGETKSYELGQISSPHME